MHGFYMTAPVILLDPHGLQRARAYDGNLEQPVVIVLGPGMLLAYFH